MTLKTLFKCDFNVKTKSYLPISKKGMTKIPLPKKTSLAESLIAQKITFVARTPTQLPVPFLKTRQTRALFTS